MGEPEAENCVDFSKDGEAIHRNWGLGARGRNLDVQVSAGR